jgi:hypothetical protein
MTQNTNPRPSPTDADLAALYSACLRRDMRAADEVAAAINVRLGLGDDDPPEWLLDLVVAGIEARVAQPAKPGQGAAA